ncbi:MAG: tRNA (guanosine(37)-N1)-methyltransferase TrmD [Bacteroidetes bacterium]|nr:tRNA (guanosine(37)-N1)-methyltransferase TrmD [Bacteroidota bacterium]
MRIDIISAVPGFFDGPLNNSIIKRGQTKGKVEIHVHNLRDYAYDKHRMIDDKPFGGGAGMVLKVEPFFDCILKLKSERDYDAIIFTAPHGKIYDQQDANRYSLMENIMIICGHYKGIDDRVREAFATEIVSIGNFVLTGGELLAMVLVDSVVRIIPGVLNDSESALDDSFQDGDMIGAPCYTRPAEFRGLSVPEVLLQGDHGKVREWREDQSKILTDYWKKINKIGAQV